MSISHLHVSALFLLLNLLCLGPEEKEEVSREGVAARAYGCIMFCFFSHTTQHINEGGATMDWIEHEKERVITIISAATTCE